MLILLKNYENQIEIGLYAQFRQVSLKMLFI